MFSIKNLFVYVLSIVYLLYSFVFSVHQEEEALANLELEYDLQSKITSAALRLAHDNASGKSVRKQRRSSYQKAHTKVSSV